MYPYEKKEKKSCKYCGADISPKDEETCIHNTKYWKEWFKEFHKQLDSAIAVFLQENSGSGLHNIKLPSQTTLMEFMSWSYEKTLSGEILKKEKKK